MNECLNMSTSQTFQLTVNGESIGPVTDQPRSRSLVSVLKDCDVVEKKKGRLLTSTNPNNSVKAALGNSFIGAIYDAYSHHHKLVLRPDDVWLSIVLAFADYVDNNAEAMREYFVTHEGKNQLIVEIDTDLATVNNWSGIVKQFSDKISENTLNSVRNWIEPRFTTTTENDSLIARMALMGTLKNYFAYGCRLKCGIPEVTLMGTLQDWESLRTKIEEIVTFALKSSPTHSKAFTKESKDLMRWREILLGVANEFIASYKGVVNNNFWQSCANSSGGGSGPTYISGWILAFAPFAKGQWRLNTPDTIKSTGVYGKIETTDFTTSATVEVPCKISDGTREYEVFFYAGGIVNSYDTTTNTICPSYDFAMFQVPKGTIADEMDWDDIWVKPTKNGIVPKIAPGSRPILHKVPGHSYLLSHINSGIEARNCGSCRKYIPENTQSYQCISDCNYNYCFDCYDKDYREGLGEDREKTVISGYHQHVLNYDSDKIRSRICDVCRSSIDVAGYQCTGCGFDLCFKCFDTPLEKREKTVTIPDHSHALNLEKAPSNRCRCDICERSIPVASYRCTACDFDCCFACYGKRGLKY